MTFNPKKYLGKNRIYRPVSGAPRVSRLYVWDGTEYVAPDIGKCYMARRYEPSFTGKSKRVERFFATLAEARSWQTGEVEDSKTKSLSDSYRFGQLLQDWQNKGWATLRESTRIYYTKAIRLFAFLYAVEVEKLTPGHIDAWIEDLKENSHKFRASRKNFLHELDILGVVIRWYIDQNDHAKLVVPFKKRHRKAACLKEGVTRQKKFMYPEEVDRFLYALKEVAPEFLVMAFVQLNQVMRISEVAAMKWSNLNMPHRSYRMCEHVIWPRVNGATAKLIMGTKTMKSGQYFDMPLRDEVVALLGAAMNQRIHETDLMFHDGGQLLTYRQIQFAYNKAFEKAGLPYRSTHVLRHSGATKFLNETGDYLALQQFGNWSDLQTALVYGKIQSNRAREALDKTSKHRLKLVSGSGIEDVI